MPASLAFPPEPHAQMFLKCPSFIGLLEVIFHRKLSFWRGILIKAKYVF